MTARPEAFSDHSDIQLSVVATSRNDNHGGSLTARMQHFVDGFVAQCKRHGLRAELILVEWNPPKERAPLIDELRWPSDTGPCDIRIITVARDIHENLEYSDKIPLFQMIAKNAGIRRARGQFVLATNIDILFSDGVIRFMRDQLQTGKLYRTARVDIPATIPNNADFTEVLRFCESQAFRIHGPGITVVRRSANWSRFDLLQASMDPRLAYAVYLCGLLRFDHRPLFRLLFQPRKLAAALKRFALGVGPDFPLPEFTRSKLTLSLFWYVCKGVCRRFVHAIPALIQVIFRRVGEIPQVLRRLVLRSPFTNACGDFTLCSREEWFKLRGYLEWRIFSWHLDSVLMYQAMAAGLQEKCLSSGERIFHIEHGKGYTPEAAAELFSHLSQQGIPFLSNADLEDLRARIMSRQGVSNATLFNDSSWGLGDIALPESAPPLTTEKTMPCVVAGTAFVK